MSDRTLHINAADDNEALRYATVWHQNTDAAVQVVDLGKARDQKRFGVIRVEKAAG